MKIMDTPTLLMLARDADKHQRNKRLDVGRLQDDLDPEGIHVVAWSMMHNDFEARIDLFMKVKGSEDPVEGMLDIDLRQYNALVDWEPEAAK